MRKTPDILQEICARKREEISLLKRRGEGALREMAGRQSAPRGFRAALTSSKAVSLIAEIKKASPSAGVIRTDFEPAAIARLCEDGGARCLSVLTDQEFFQGKLDFMQQARNATGLPVLRKDFIVDAIQVLEARAFGADCVLLIAAALESEALASLIEEARLLEMDALVEVHNEKEVESALEAGAEMIGINNRDLHTFQVSLKTTADLAPKIPRVITKVSESGIRSRGDVEMLKRCGIDAVLVGEHLMRQKDIAAAARELSEV